MAHLFVVENNIAKPNTETLLMSPYKEIWNRDKSKDKSDAIRDFTFIEFMISKKKSNPYAGYDEESRRRVLGQLLYKDDNFYPDRLIEEGLHALDTFQKEASPAYTFLLAAEEAANKLKDFFRTFDLTERNVKTGMPVYKPKDISSAINDSEQNIRTLHNLKEKVEQELFEATKTRNNRTINPFEV